MLEDNLVLVGAFLNPCFRHLIEKPSDKFELMKATLRNLAPKQDMTKRKTKVLQNLPEDFLEYFQREDGEEAEVRYGIYDEIKRYMAREASLFEQQEASSNKPIYGRGASLGLWYYWKEQSNEFPLLSQVAEKLMSVQLSSTDPEKFFQDQSSCLA